MSTSTRPSTASTMAGSASMVAGAVSSWRPPWLLTMTPAAPVSAACRASSGWTMPFSSTGSFVSPHSHSTSFHDSVWSNSEAT